MSDFLDAKLDARFLEALKEHDSLDGAVAEWLGISSDEARRAIDRPIPEMMEEYTGTSADVDIFRVLKDIKPDATLGDFLRVKFLVSKAVAMNCPETIGGGNGIDWVAEALRPRESEMLVILMDDEGNVGALKAQPELIMSVFGALTMALQAKAMAEQLAEAGGDILAMLKGLEDEGDEGEEDTPGDEDENA